MNNKAHTVKKFFVRMSNLGVLSKIYSIQPMIFVLFN